MLAIHIVHLNQYQMVQRFVYPFWLQIDNMRHLHINMQRFEFNGERFIYKYGDLSF